MKSPYAGILDEFVTKTEDFLLYHVRRWWQYEGNIKVETFALARTLISEPKLPAIVVSYAPQITLRPIIGGFIPQADFFIACVLPYLGTADALNILQLFTSRTASLLLSITKSPLWNELQVRDLRIVRAQEQPPRWEAAVINIFIRGKPITIAPVAQSPLIESSFGEDTFVKL